LRPTKLGDLALGTVFRDCEDCLERVRVPVGGFDMGMPDDEAGQGANEIPGHKVIVSYPPALSLYPVTRGQWSVSCQRGSPRRSTWRTP
jgi:formylglycine-generating enzyme required for sulfatase activity